MLAHDKLTSSDGKGTSSTKPDTDTGEKALFRDIHDLGKGYPVRRAEDCPRPNGPNATQRLGNAANTDANTSVHANASAQGSGEASQAMVQRATVLDQSHAHQHAFKAPAATHAAEEVKQARLTMPNDPPRVLLDSGASHQVMRTEADSTNGTYSQRLNMAAGKRKGRTAIDEKSIPTLYIPHESRAGPCAE